MNKLSKTGVNVLFLSGALLFNSSLTTYAAELLNQEQTTVKLCHREIEDRALGFVAALKAENSDIQFNETRILDDILTGKLCLERLKIRVLPEEIGTLLNLTEINLYNNYLRNLPTSLGNLAKLEVLRVDKNQLTTFPEEIGGLKQLTKLIADHNYLSELPDSIKNLKNLKELFLGNNRLSSLSSCLGQLESLVAMHVNDNQLTEVSSDIGNLTNLRQLYLEYNHLTSMPTGILNLRELSLLNLSGNQLTEIPNCTNLFPRLIILRLNGNPLLAQGEADHLWGREELIDYFHNRVVLDVIPITKMPGDTKLSDVFAALDRQSPRINRDSLKAARLPDLPEETIEDGNEFLSAFFNLVSCLNFSDEDKPGYLSYDLLSGDYASEGREDNTTNFDKVSTYLTPRLTGYFKTLYGLKIKDNESRGWQMYEENIPALKKVLSFIIKKTQELNDPEQRSMLFLLLVDGILHCPTGQKEGIDTVALSLLGHNIVSSDIRELLRTYIALKKTMHFKTAILAKGANNTQNVHLISAYEGQVREILGLSNLIGYKEVLGILNYDPFNGNHANVVKVYFDLLPVQRLVDWIMEKVQTRSDIELRLQYEALEDKRLKLATVKHPKASSSLQRMISALKTKIESDDTPLQEKSALKTQLQQLESIQSKQQETKDAVSLAYSEEDKSLLDLQIKELRRRLRISSQFHPISTALVVHYLYSQNVHLSSINWWEGYFTANPETNRLATLSREGVFRLLHNLNYLIVD